MNNFRAVNDDDAEFSEWETEDGKISVDLLWEDDCVQTAHTFQNYVRLHPDFLTRPAHEALTLDYGPFIEKIVEKHMNEGLKVGHVVVYDMWAYDSLRQMLELGLVTPMKDGLGRKLSEMVDLCEADFPKEHSELRSGGSRSRTFLRLKQIEMNEEVKQRMILFSYLTSNVRKQREQVLALQKSKNAKSFLPGFIPMEILKLVGKFLFTNKQIKGRIIEESDNEDEEEEEEEEEEEDDDE